MPPKALGHQVRGAEELGSRWSRSRRDLTRGGLRRGLSGTLLPPSSRWSGQGSPSERAQQPHASLQGGSWPPGGVALRCRRGRGPRPVLGRHRTPPVGAGPRPRIESPCEGCCLCPAPWPFRVPIPGATQALRGFPQDPPPKEPPTRPSGVRASRGQGVQGQGVWGQGWLRGRGHWAGARSWEDPWRSPWPPPEHQSSRLLLLHVRGEGRLRPPAPGTSGGGGLGGGPVGGMQPRSSTRRPTPSCLSGGPGRRQDGAGGWETVRLSVRSPWERVCGSRRRGTGCGPPDRDGGPRARPGPALPPAGAVGWVCRGPEP